MRRSLILTVAAVVGMVLLAMLVPMAVLVQSYALEERISRAALEVQATETVVSEQGQDKGGVAVYVEEINRTGSTLTTVLYPDGTGVGPHPGEDARVAQARATGQARVDNAGSGAELLVPVSLGGPEATPVIRVDVLGPGLGSGVMRAWLVLAGLGVTLLVGSLVLADRLGRSFVQPLRALAGQATRLGEQGARPEVTVAGPAEVREVAVALDRLLDRVETLLERDRRAVSDLSHRLRTPVTALRLRIDGVPDPEARARLAADLDELDATVDHVVREARRSEREGLVAQADAVAVLTDRARFWEPLAEDQGRTFRLAAAPGPLLVRASAADLVALVDVLLDNVFTHSPDGVAVSVAVGPGPSGRGALLVVEDAGPGYPADREVTHRGASGSGSTGLGLSIVAATAEESGGSLALDRSPLGGARATVVLGPPHVPHVSHRPLPG